MSQISNHDRAAPARTQVRMETVGAEHAGRRIDNFLLQLLKPAPKSLVYKLLRSGQVRVNGGRAKPEYRLAAGDQLRVPPVELVVPGETHIPDARLTELAAAIVYEDDDFLVVDKPAGLACHGGTGVRYGVIETARVLRPDIERLDLVHRLDRDTSGCLVLAKRVDALRRLHEEMRLHRVEKRYRALLAGQLPPGLERISASLSSTRTRGAERRAEVDEEGKDSETIIEDVRRCGAHSLVGLRLVTGRMHQIRAHARHIGHPVAGDRAYGDDTLNKELTRYGLRRLFLHAESFTFTSGGTRITVTAPLPAALADVVDALERAA